MYNDTYSMDVKGSLKRTSGQLLVNVTRFLTLLRSSLRPAPISVVLPW